MSNVAEIVLDLLTNEKLSTEEEIKSMAANLVKIGTLKLPKRTAISHHLSFEPFARSIEEHVIEQQLKTDGKVFHLTKDTKSSPVDVINTIWLEK